MAVCPLLKPLLNLTWTVTQICLPWHWDKCKVASALRHPRCTSVGPSTSSAAGIRRGAFRRSSGQRRRRTKSFDLLDASQTLRATSERNSPGCRSCRLMIQNFVKCVKCIKWIASLPIVYTCIWGRWERMFLVADYQKLCPFNMYHLDKAVLLFWSSTSCIKRLTETEIFEFWVSFRLWIPRCLLLAKIHEHTDWTNTKKTRRGQQCMLRCR